MTDDMNPAQLEAEDAETATIEWRGETFVLPATVDDWPIDALEAFEAGRAAAAVRALLDEDQYARMKRLGGKVRDFNEFGELIARLFGFDSAGN